MPGGIFLLEQFQHSSFGSAFSGFHITFPNIGVSTGTQQHDFDSCTGFLFSEHSCPDHTGIIADERIAGIEIVHDIGKHSDFAVSGFHIQDQHSGITAFFRRGLCNQFFGKLIIKITCAHLHTSFCKVRRYVPRRNLFSCRFSAFSGYLPDVFLQCPQPSGWYLQGNPDRDPREQIP